MSDHQNLLPGLGGTPSKVTFIGGKLAAGQDVLKRIAAGNQGEAVTVQFDAAPRKLGDYSGMQDLVAAGPKAVIDKWEPPAPELEPTDGEASARWKEIWAAPRYHITDDLWNSFTCEQVTKQVERMRADGRLQWPHGGQPFTVRISENATLEPDARARDALTDTGEAQVFYDMFFDPVNAGDLNLACEGETPPQGKVGFGITANFRICQSGVKWSDTERALDHWGKSLASELNLDAVVRRWREKNWFCFDATLPREQIESWCNGIVMRLALWVLVILLHDRRTHKEIIEPTKRQPAKLWKRMGKERPPVLDTAAEIVLHIPQRVYTGQLGGTHASPRMHYRAEHVRQQAVGEVVPVV